MNTDTAIWSKSNKSWGSARRMQRNLYAYRVAVAMAGREGICPSCGESLDLRTVEVDRVRPELDYRPSNIVMVCVQCNQGRAQLQSAGLDWARVADYADAVADASKRVEIPTVREARAHAANVADMRSGRVSKFA